LEKGKYQYFLMYKPYGVLSQFGESEESGKNTLPTHSSFPEGIYPIGKLDEESEGLLLLTNDPAMNKLILGKGLEKEFWVQVENLVEDERLTMLSEGVEIRTDGKNVVTAPAIAELFTEVPDLPEREVKIRYRREIPTSWIRLVISEKLNRPIRKMTAAVGHPTLRLVRFRIGEFTIEGLAPGEVMEVSTPFVSTVFRPIRTKQFLRNMNPPKRRRGQKKLKRVKTDE